MMIRYFILSLFVVCAMASASAQTYEQLINKGLEAIQNNQLPEAERSFKKALKADPSNLRNGMLFANLGTIQRRLGKKDAAIESYTLAINVLPYSVPIRLDRASLYMEKHLFEKAYIDYCNVIDLDRTNEEALLYRAYIYMQKRKNDEARMDYKVLLDEHPSHKPARLGLALLNQKEGRYKEALNEYDELIRIYPEDSSLLKGKIYVEMEMKAYDSALLDLETLEKVTPQDAELFVMRGDIFLKQEKKSEAHAAFKQAMAFGASRGELDERLKASK